MTRAHVTTFVVGLLGVGVFMVLGLPLPWLFGPLTACLVAALWGIEMKSVKPLNNAMRTILGVAVGATITVAFLHDLSRMWPTLLIIPIMTAAIGFVGVPYFQKIWGYDWATSYYSAMPGGLQDMLVFGEEAGGNVRTMSLIHATRVLIIVMALPFILKFYWDADLSNAPGATASSIPHSQLLIMVFCGLAGWQIAKHIGMFGASILGPLVLAAIMTLLGILEHRPPAEAIWMAQFFIAITVGVKYVGITSAEIKRDIVAGIGFCGILIVLTLVFVGIVQVLNLAPPQETILALAPGGQAEMVILALIVGADMTFVIAHHLLRIVIIIMGAPLAARLFNKKA